MLSNEHIGRLFFLHHKQLIECELAYRELEDRRLSHPSDFGAAEERWANARQKEQTLYVGLLNLRREPGVDQGLWQHGVSKVDEETRQRLGLTDNAFSLVPLAP